MATKDHGTGDKALARRRGRPRSSEGPIVTQEDIVREALISLTGSGISGLVLREIARRLGVSLPTIQRHFPTKDDLWRACVDSVVKEIPIRVEEEPIDGEAIEQRVIDVIRNAIRRAALSPHATAAMWNDREPGAEERLEYLVAQMTPLVETARSRLRVAVELGLVRDVDPEVFFSLVSLGVSSLGRSSYPLKQMFGIDLLDGFRREAFADSLADLLLYGLLPRETRE